MVIAAGVLSQPDQTLARRSEGVDRADSSSQYFLLHRLLSRLVVVVVGEHERYAVVNLWKLRDRGGSRGGKKAGEERSGVGG